MIDLEWNDNFYPRFHSFLRDKSKVKRYGLSHIDNNYYVYIYLGSIQEFVDLFRGCLCLEIAWLEGAIVKDCFVINNKDFFITDNESVKYLFED